MAGKDSDQNYHPQESEISSKPKWVTLHRDMFQEGTVGYDIFPQILEGRDRPETMFDQPVKSLWTGPARAVSELENIGILTIGDVMNITQDEFKGFARKYEIKEKVENHLRDQAITPHARLLQSIYDKVQLPVPPNREKEIVEAVERVISKPVVYGPEISKRERRIIRLIFGLDDGIKHSHEDIGKSDPYNPVGSQRIKNIEAKVLRKLRRSGRSKDTKGFLTIPEGSFASKTFGAVLLKDIPSIDIENLSLSQVTIDELLQKGLHVNEKGMEGWRARGEILTHDFSETGLSNESFVELSEKLKGLAESDISSNDATNGDQTELTVNNLIPEISLSDEELDSIGIKNIIELGMSVRLHNCLWRSGIKRIGQVLGMDRTQFSRIRNLGFTARKEFGERLEAFLELPEDRYKKGEITGLFTTEDELRTVRGAQVEEIDKETVILINIRRAVRSALKERCIFSEDIQKWIASHGKNIGFDPNGEITLALIEYVISHPSKAGK